jgi:phosphate transport system protein
MPSWSATLIMPSKVWYKDESIDSTYSVFRELLTYMMEDPQNIGLCTHLYSGLRTSSGLATTPLIAEIVYLLAHGTAINDQGPKADTTNISLAAVKGM